MNIAIDFDHTYTEDPEMWDHIIKHMESCGHTVYCVTARYVTEPVPFIPVDPSRMWYTSRKAKLVFLATHGVIIDVWIDDDPQYINKDHGDLLEWSDERMDDFIATHPNYQELYERKKND